MIDTVEKVDIDYISILDYLRDNSEISYANPNADGISETEKQRLSAIKERGENVVAEMTRMAATFAKLYKLDTRVPIPWLDNSQTKTCKYLSAHLKYQTYAENPVSISLFVEKTGPESTRFRISLNINDDSADAETMSRYHSYLDVPINPDSGLVLAAGSNEWGNPVVLNKTVKPIRSKAGTPELRKVQLCFNIERKNNETNEYYHNECCKGIEALIPYYEHVIGIDKRGIYPSPEEYDPGISAERYEQILSDTSIIKYKFLDVLYYLYKLGGEASCTQIANRFGNHPSHYTANSTYIARAVADKTKCTLWKRNGTDKPAYWPVLFTGYEKNNQNEGTFRFIMRNPLKEAIKNLDENGYFTKIDTMNEEEFDTNIILYGPPGTGKTYNSAIYAVAICDGKSLDELTDYEAVMKRYNELKEENRVTFTTFHQSYGYEEFIEGIKPVMGNESKDVSYTIEDGVFKKFCKNAKSVQKTDRETETELPYVFIIDEINRGNISKIFGELITLIETTKREGMPEAASVILPYSRESFSVPSNVYLLGTMNTADRSIALMDTALRRRFQFIEMMPDTDVLSTIKVKDGDIELDVAKMLKAINERISFLYDREHTIGHAFFIGLKENPHIGKLASIFSKSVIPLLQEYFYEDYQKIQFVLGDNGKTDDTLKFIKDSKVGAKDIFKGSIDDSIDLPEKRYEVNKDALYRIQSYVEII